MPTGWFGKISWPVFLHCKSTAIIWLHNTHENTPERKYKMPDYILQFFNSSYWALISNVFTAIGVISVILAIVRFVHNRRRKEWKSNVSIQDYSTDYDVEMECRNAIYSKVWTEEPTVGISTIVFRPVDCVIPKLEVYGFDSNGKKDGVIESFSDLTPEDAVCFRLERAECIPQYKIRWYSEYGEYAEHVFSDNLRNGINTVDGIEYRINFVSVLRRALDLR